MPTISKDAGDVMDTAVNGQEKILPEGGNISNKTPNFFTRAWISPLKALNISGTAPLADFHGLLASRTRFCSSKVGHFSFIASSWSCVCLKIYEGETIRTIKC